jgi:hypothetical protein
VVHECGGDEESPEEDNVIPDAEHLSGGVTMSLMHVRSRGFVAVALAFAVVPVHLSIYGNPRTEGDKSLRKPTTNEHYRPFLINNVFNYYGNNGDGSFNKIRGDHEGFEFPRGSGLHTTFEDGIIWGGFHGGRSIPKAGGSEYWHALQAGKILRHGNATTAPLADNPASPNYRVYRVRPDVNPSVTFDGSVGAWLDSEEVVFIRRYEPASAADLFNQYIKDWNEWPAADGAPFRDVNGNGVYDPSVDVPGVPGADQTLWYVANDLDSGRVSQLAGCPPIGLEMQRTIWGYRRSGVLGNVIFARTRLINKSGSGIDSMFIGQWADMDLGDPPDDDVACDTARDFGYAYGGRPFDYRYGYAVPSGGFVLLQGPIVPGLPGDTAVFGTGIRAGYRNLRMSSFNFSTNGVVAYLDPNAGFGGDISRYSMLNGSSRDGVARVNPLTGQVSKLPFSGDPVTNTGWNESQSSIFPTDIRLQISCGPFAMADGDTQELVVAHLAAQGLERFSSIVLLRKYADIVRSMYPDLIHSAPPDVRAGVQYTAIGATLSVVADAKATGAKSITAILKRKDRSTVTQFQLFDDGAHGDGGSNDAVFANAESISRQQLSIAVTLVVTDLQGQTHTWENTLQGVTTAGSLTAGRPVIFSDNLNSDGKANPGENLRYGVTIRNNTAFNLVNLVATTAGATRQIASIPAGGVDSMVYIPADPGSYMSVDMPSGDRVPPISRIPISVYDGNGNSWNDSLEFVVYPVAYAPSAILLNRISGLSTGNFGLLVVDPLQFRNHVYHITGVDSINQAGDAGFTVQDSTDGRTILLNHPLPDELGHNIPVTDGFKIELGTNETRSGMLTSTTPSSSRLLWGAGEVTNVLALEGFGGTIGNAQDHWYSGGTGSRMQHSVFLRFASVDTTGFLLNPSDTVASFAYRYVLNASAPPARPEFGPFIKNTGAGTAYQDYTRTLPFTAYDIDTNPPRRLMVGYLENNVPAGLVDGKYWPPLVSGQDNGISNGPREWFFIFSLPYRETPDPQLQVNILTTHVPMMWLGYPARGVRASAAGGNTFTIIASHPPGSVDLWSFVLKHDDYFPAAYTVSQNYPNPFNPTTTIQYTLPYPSNVNLTIYNILGQRIRVLVNESQYAGDMKVVWDGTNSAGVRVASGVYFYRLQATGIADPNQSWNVTRKMIVMR